MEQLQTATQPGPLTKTTSQLATELASLNKLLVTLESRLGPVLAQSRDRKFLGHDHQQHMAPLLQVALSNTIKAQNAKVMVQDLLERLAT